MIKKLVVFSILPLMISCNGQEKQIAKSLVEEALELENFDFNTKISTILPDKTKSKEYSGYYEIKSEMLAVDTISDGEFSGGEKPVRIEYRQRSFSNRDIVAKFGNEEFNAINLATTIDGKIILINALKSETNLEQTKTFIETLNKKYGNSTKTKGEFSDIKFDIFTWQLKDRIIRYTTVFDDEENTLKFEIDEENKKISNGDKSSNYKGYIFIIKKEYKDQIFGKISSGDFVFLE